jgi:hypothetical protein
LKALGRALAAWTDRELARGGLLRFIDNIALLDLVGAGEPQDVVAEILGWSDAAASRRPDPPPPCGPVAEPEVYFVDLILRGPASRRLAAVKSLRVAIPADLVEDILINGRSWNQPE